MAEVVEQMGARRDRASNLPPMPAGPEPAPLVDDSWMRCSDDRSTLYRDLQEILRYELWGYRSLARELIRRDLRVRYKQAAMGCAWAVLMPVLVIVAGALVRSAIAFVGGRPVNLTDIGGMAVKALPWSFFVGAMSFATTSLTANANLITKTFFPREILPLCAVATQTIDSLLGAAVLLVVLPLAGVRLGPMILWAPLLAVCLLFLTAGGALLASCANLFFRDVKYVVQVLLAFGIFFTPVFFEPEMFGPSAARLMMLNPLAPILEGLRLSLVVGHNLLDPLVVTQRGSVILAWSPWDLAYAGTCALALLTIGLVWFHRLERKFAEYV
jgi:lipopolysaccharide transport system permease protein